ncbi:thiamine phosphate synthase, partial [Enterobacter hormaechei]|uniref:thiamine phosphate synthase n=1 Tax=Enterobacter hormaechei TaxID=158836 RepID=UPI0022F13345
LPAHYPITPADVPVNEAVTLVRVALARGERLIQWRVPSASSSDSREAIEALLPELRRFGAALVLSRDIDMARELGLGV